MKHDRPLPTPATMVAHLDRFVRGQARAKQDLAVAVYNHYLSQAYRRREGADLGRHHLLLVGPTGVGKTYLVRTLAEFLGVPVGFASAAGLVEAGYKGNSVESVVSTLLDRAGGDPRKAEQGIVFIDEVDKIRCGETGGRDVSGEGVQNALLTLLDGRTTSGLEGANHAAIDTGRLLFICTGAFVGLQEIVERRLGLGRNVIGFVPRVNEQVETMPDSPVYTALCQAQTGDLVQFGMIPEFVGRFATISVLHELSRADLRAIVGGPIDLSPLEKQRRLALIHGIELEFSGEALDAIADEATALGTGARGLHRLIGRAVDSVDYQWPELADRGVCKVTFSRDAVVNGAPPELSYGPPAASRCDVELRAGALAGSPPPPHPFAEMHADQNDGSRAASCSDSRLPPGISDTSDWTDEQLWNSLESLKRDSLAWDQCTEGSRTWWTTFETQNKHRPALVYRLAEELKRRKATIHEFFLANVVSNTDNIQANLYYLDYLQSKAEHERKPRPPA